jgi:rhodanese-related sulfurtransferase
MTQRTDQAVTSRVGGLLEAARTRIAPRATPVELDELISQGGLVVDIRPWELRQRDGEMPGAIVIDRNVLEWRLDPTSPDRCPEAADLGPKSRIVVVCDEGYASSLAASTLRDLGLLSTTDLDGGYQAWGRAMTQPERRTRPDDPS